MIKLSINVTRVDKNLLVDGKNGKYMGLVLWENKNGEDQYGNHGFVTQDISKEQRLAGVKGAILGNWKDTSRQPGGQGSPRPVAAQPHGVGEDDIPF